MSKVFAFWTQRYQRKRVDNDQTTMIYRFQDFELDEARLELRRAGADVAIQARVLRALLHLVRHRDRVVLKDELCDAVLAARVATPFDPRSGPWFAPLARPDEDAH